MNKTLIVTLLTLIILIHVDGKKSFKSGRSSGAGRSSSRKTSYNPQPVPTSLSYPQPSAPKPKPTLFGWQEKPSKNAQPPKQTKPQQTHSYPDKQPNTQTHAYPPNQAKTPNTGSHAYPSSQTGLSGNNQPKQPSYHQESIQKNSATQNLNGQPSANNQPGHSYPASTGLSGSGPGYPSQAGNGPSHQQSYPQGSGLSGAGGAPPPYPGKSNNPVNSYQHPPPPPPYSPTAYGGNYGGHVGYGGQAPHYGGYGGQGPHYGGFGGPGSYHPGPQMPGYFGNYGGYGNKGVSRGGIGTLAGVGIAGAGVGTILTGLALWNLARSTGRTHHTVIYDNRGQPVAVAPENNSTLSETDSILADLVNCSLSISNGNNTEVIAIPCAIATSFRPDADVKDLGSNTNTNDDTKCTVTVVNKEGREFMTTISCAVLLNTAKENNVTEPTITENMNATDITNGTLVISPEIQPGTPYTSESVPNQPPIPSALNLTAGSVIEGQDVTMSPMTNCTPEPGEIRDPLNPCFAVTHDLTVAPLGASTEKNENKKDK